MREPRSVAITGAATRIGQLILQRLAVPGAGRRVLAFDRHPPRSVSSDVVWDSLEPGDPAMERRLRGVDAVVHLAWAEPTPAEPDIRDLNVLGSQSLFASAGSAGARRIVYVSSGTVYGAHPDNELPLNEASALRANLDLADAAQRLEVEYVLSELARELDDVVVTVLRPAPVLGPGADNVWSRLFELPFVPAVSGHSPPLQFVHESDVADAVLFALDHDLAGAYNVAPEGGLSARDVVAITGRPRVELSEPRLFAATQSLWRKGLSDLPAGLLHYLMYPWVLSPDKLAAAGWTARSSSADALAAAAAVARPYVRMGGRRVRRSHLARGAIGIGIAGVVAGAGAIRRHREPQAS